MKTESKIEIFDSVTGVSDIIKQTKGTLEYKSGAIYGVKNLGWKYQHLYILSDEVIKEGEFCFHSEHGVRRVIPYPGYSGDGKEKCTLDAANSFHKKIIATTDNSLFEIIDSNCALCDNTHRLVDCTKINGFRVCDCIVRLPQIPIYIIKAYIESYNNENPFNKLVVEYERLSNKGEWKDVLLPSEWGDSNPKRPKLNKDGTLAVNLLVKPKTAEEAVLAYREFAWKNGVTLMDCEKWIKEHL